MYLELYRHFIIVLKTVREVAMLWMQTLILWMKNVWGALRFPKVAPDLQLRRQEAGTTLIGVILWIALLVLAVTFIVKVMPAYYHYWSLEHIVSQQAQQAGHRESASQIHHDLSNRLDVAMINVPRNDIVVEKNDSGSVRITVTYDRTIHLVGNASLLLHFQAVGHN